jgi:hypothetical protein
MHYLKTSLIGLGLFCLMVTPFAYFVLEKASAQYDEIADYTLRMYAVKTNPQVEDAFYMLRSLNEFPESLEKLKVIYNQNGGWQPTFVMLSHQLKEWDAKYGDSALYKEKRMLTRVAQLDEGERSALGDILLNGMKNSNPIDRLMYHYAFQSMPPFRNLMTSDQQAEYDAYLTQATREPNRPSFYVNQFNRFISVIPTV